MLSRSAKSILTIKSLSEDNDSQEQQQEEDEEIPTTFEDLLPYLLNKYSAPIEVYVKKVFVADPFNQAKSSHLPKTPRKVPRTTKNKALEDEILISRTPEQIDVAALYDKDNELVEVQIIGQRHTVPGILLKIIGSTAPDYQQLTKITIKRSRMDLYTIYELRNNLDTLLLTDICLDGSYVSEGNFAILLEKESCLNHLSLCRCWINDSVCETIVSKLQFPAVAEKQLLTLHLSGNFITDKGAESICRMLRTNRHLRYINLSGNRLSDEGAGVILDMLKDFRLTLDENYKRRQSIMTFLKRKNKLLTKFLAECNIDSNPNLNTKDNAGKSVPELNKSKNVHMQQYHNNANKTYETRLRRAEAMAIKMIGQYQDPFGPGKTVLKDGWTRCKGNFSLCYLNLSYNDLTQFSVVKVLEILLYQQQIDRHKPEEPGLLKIVLEGNLMSKTCPEYEQIKEIINKNLKLKNDTAKSFKKRG